MPLTASASLSVETSDATCALKVRHGIKCDPHGDRVLKYSSTQSTQVLDSQYTSTHVYSEFVRPLLKFTLSNT